VLLILFMTGWKQISADCPDILPGSFYALGGVDSPGFLVSIDIHSGEEKMILNHGLEIRDGNLAPAATKYKFPRLYMVGDDGGIGTVFIAANALTGDIITQAELNPPRVATWSVAYDSKRDLVWGASFNEDGDKLLIQTIDPVTGKFNYNVSSMDHSYDYIGSMIVDTSRNLLYIATPDLLITYNIISQSYKVVNIPPFGILGPELQLDTHGYLYAFQLQEDYSMFLAKIDPNTGQITQSSMQFPASEVVDAGIDFGTGNIFLMIMTGGFNSNFVQLINGNAKKWNSYNCSELNDPNFNGQQTELDRIFYLQG